MFDVVDRVKAFSTLVEHAIRDTRFIPFHFCNEARPQGLFILKKPFIHRGRLQGQCAKIRHGKRVQRSSL